MTQAFARAFYEKADGLVPSMPLGATIELGSIVEFAGGSWHHISSIAKKFGMTLPTIPAARATQGNSFAVTGGAKFSFKAYGDGQAGQLITKVADAKARAEVVYGSEGAFMATVLGQKLRRLGNLEELYHAIRMAYYLRDELPSEMNWQKQYAVVVAVAQAKSYVANIGSTKDAGLVISGKGRLGPPKTAGDVSARMSFSFTKAETVRVEAAPAEDYAFQAIQIDPKWYRQWDKERFKLTAPGVLAIRAFGAEIAASTLGRAPGALELLVRLSTMTPPGPAPADAFVIADATGRQGRRRLPRAALKATGPARKSAKRTTSRA